LGCALSIEKYGNTETKKQLSSCRCIELNGVPEIETLLLLTALSVMISLNICLPTIKQLFILKLKKKNSTKQHRCFKTLMNLEEIKENRTIHMHSDKASKWQVLDINENTNNSSDIHNVREQNLVSSQQN
jgi:hypothetical protein